MSATPPRNNAAKTPGHSRGRPFAPGNPGRPRGAKHKITRACEALLEKDAAAITAKAVELAKAGDLTALRLCLDRIVPPRRERAIVFDLPPINAIADLPSALLCVLKAVSRGEILPSEAASGVLARGDAQRI